MPQEHYTSRSASHAWRKARALADEQKTGIWPCAIRPDALSRFVNKVVVVQEELPKANPLDVRTWRYIVYTT